MMKRLGSEFIGTYALVTAGCGAIVTDNLTGALTHIGVAITFGMIITVMIAASGHISGAHFNPAVTIAFALTRHLHGVMFPPMSPLNYSEVLQAP